MRRFNQAFQRHDPDALTELVAEDCVIENTGPARWREPELEAPHELILPMVLKLDGGVARMFSTVTTVATPHDVTLQELHVEVFYPADRRRNRSFRPMSSA